MFAVTAFDALHLVVRVKGQTTTTTWEPCRVVGVDASSAEIEYLVETRSTNGEYSLARESYIKKTIQ